MKLSLFQFSKDESGRRHLLATVTEKETNDPKYVLKLVKSRQTSKRGMKT